MNATKTRILIVDDHPLVREGLAMRISMQPDLEICGEAASEEEALQAAKQTQPQLALVDISLNSGSGVELIKQLRSLYPHLKMLVISGFDESLYAERVLRGGALGFLNKRESNDKLIEAIRTVLSGHRFISPAMAERLVGQSIGEHNESVTPVERLSDRELEVFRCIGSGLTSSTIASRLFLSTHTIDTHRENIKRKLGLKNASELTRAAVQWVLEMG